VAELACGAPNSRAPNYTLKAKTRLDT